MLHAEAENHGLWRDWSGAGCENFQDDCTVVMNGPKAVTANFFEGPRLNVIVTGVGATPAVPQSVVVQVGYAPAIGGPPAALECTTNCNVTGRFRRGASVIIKLFPPPNLGRWGGECTGTASSLPTCTITMGDDLSDNVIRTVRVRYFPP
jgi:hypothetical protein